MQYAVTIGIPVYNIGKYVSRMMESILAQTFDSIEFLVLDDCGTDDSMDIIRRFQREHPRGKDIRIVRQPQNGGLGNARNRIIDEARGRYLYHLDGDDSIAPNTIQLLYDAVKHYNAQIAYGSHMRIEESGDEVRQIPFQYPSLAFSNGDQFATWAYRKYDGLQGMTWNFLIDIDIYRKNRLYHQPVNYWEDFSFTLDLPTYITRAVLLPDITYYYYCRQGSLSHFQKRSHIDKSEIEKTIRAVNQNKEHTDRLRLKPYFPGRMYKLMMTDFYMVCSILHNETIISPSFSKQEMRDVLRSPLCLSEILRFKEKRAANLLLYVLSILPPTLSVAAIRWLGRRKGLI